MGGRPTLMISHYCHCQLAIVGATVWKEENLIFWFFLILCCVFFCFVLVLCLTKWYVKFNEKSVTIANYIEEKKNNKTTNGYYNKPQKLKKKTIMKSKILMLMKL